MSDPGQDRSERRSRRLLVAGVVLASFVLGVGATAAVSGLLGRGSEPTGGENAVQQADVGTRTERVDGGSGERRTLDEFDLTSDPGEGAGAAGPREAVEGFLDAEQQSDYATSYTFLSAAERGEFRSPEGWLAQHADLMPPVTGYEVEAVDESEERARVTTLTRFEPGLDRVTGLTPKRARIDWTVVKDDDGWGVAFDDSDREPLYPPESRAPSAVASWVSSRQSCEQPAEREFDGRLLGPGDARERLCGTSGEVEVGGVGAFRQASSSGGYLAAYGEGVTSWARIVPVAEPVEMDVVVAPVADEWTVIGTVDEEVGIP